jgi:hypothetical protein
VIRVPVCARVSRVCPGSPGVFLPYCTQRIWLLKTAPKLPACLGVRCARPPILQRVWGQSNAERLRPGQTRPALACCTRINRLTGLVDADGGAAGPVVSSSIIIGD